MSCCSLFHQIHSDLVDVFFPSCDFILSMCSLNLLSPCKWNTNDILHVCLSVCVCLRLYCGSSRCFIMAYKSFNQTTHYYFSVARCRWFLNGGKNRCAWIFIRRIKWNIKRREMRLYKTALEMCARTKWPLYNTHINTHSNRLMRYSLYITVHHSTHVHTLVTDS